MAAYYLRFLSSCDQTAITENTTTSISWSRSGTTVTVTHNAHGMANGDSVKITASSATTPLPNADYVISNVATNTYQITGVNSGATSGTCTDAHYVWYDASSSGTRYAAAPPQDGTADITVVNQGSQIFTPNNNAHVNYNNITATNTGSRVLVSSGYQCVVQNTWSMNCIFQLGGAVVAGSGASLSATGDGTKVSVVHNAHGFKSYDYASIGSSGDNTIIPTNTFFSIVVTDANNYYILYAGSVGSTQINITAYRCSHVTKNFTFGSGSTLTVATPIICINNGNLTFPASTSLWGGANGAISFVGTCQVLNQTITYGNLFSYISICYGATITMNGTTLIAVEGTAYFGNSGTIDVGSNHFYLGSSVTMCWGKGCDFKSTSSGIIEMFITSGTYYDYRTTTTYSNFLGTMQMSAQGSAAHGIISATLGAGATLKCYNYQNVGGNASFYFGGQVVNTVCENFYVDSAGGDVNTNITNSAYTMTIKGNINLRQSGSWNSTLTNNSNNVITLGSSASGTTKNIYLVGNTLASVVVNTATANDIKNFSDTGWTITSLTMTAGVSQLPLTGNQTITNITGTGGTLKSATAGVRAPVIFTNQNTLANLQNVSFQDIQTSLPKSVNAKSCKNLGNNKGIVFKDVIKYASM